MLPREHRSAVIIEQCEQEVDGGDTVGAESERMLMRNKTHHARVLAKALRHVKRGYKPFPLWSWHEIPRDKWQMHCL
jgi:hypothetical protein